MSEATSPCCDVKIIAIIPAFNEEESIAPVITDVRHHLPEADILVIDDGSTDKTAALAKAAGAIVIRLPHNLGIGAAMQTGFIFAAERGYNVAIQVDGDGQHDAAEIPKILHPLLQQEGDMIIGSRFLTNQGYAAPLARRSGIVFLATLISAITRRKVTDPTSGFRAANRQVIEFCAREYPCDYPEPETIVLFRRAGFKTVEKPVRMKERSSGRSSITLSRAIYYMVKVTLAILIGLLRQPPKVKTSEVPRGSS